MPSERLAQLHAMLADEPGDRFLRYAIALENKRNGNMEAAAADLESLLREDPKYIACYYQLAVILADLGRTAEAVEACKSGALQCLVTGDAKARAELLALHAQLLGED
ncbi:MAG: tetratricopeptide repeat protein [Bacteroidetes bacterium]|nr:tetratricopeptide repeat protein [Bacteroidota bacterium]MBS1942758.1 tetratricopeptide repeat protein [Bacteroidota bacterium]